MLSRQSHLDFFASYDSPIVNITADCRCHDFVASAKTQRVPPFAVLLHALATTSMLVEPFRRRLMGGRLTRVEHLNVSYTVIGADNNVNFSTFQFHEPFAQFLACYLADREEARQATYLRRASMENRDYLFVTCLPWLAFTAIQHPIARFGDCSIPNIAVGRFKREGEDVSFPIAIQAHHGLVDGLHISEFITTLAGVLNVAAAEICDA
ncbi:chloramphenicol O-acetyltransferase type A [Nitrospirillum viridazoti]|nr:chloramphenicol O-acetyltransferase type A [Nitrospirillum amazonense]